MTLLDILRPAASGLNTNLAGTYKNTKNLASDAFKAIKRFETDTLNFTKDSLAEIYNDVCSISATIGGSLVSGGFIRKSCREFPLSRTKTKNPPPVPIAPVAPAGYEYFYYTGSGTPIALQEALDIQHQQNIENYLADIAFVNTPGFASAYDEGNYSGDYYHIWLGQNGNLIRPLNAVGTFLLKIFISYDPSLPTPYLVINQLANIFSWKFPGIENPGYYFTSGGPFLINLEIEGSTLPAPRITFIPPPPPPPPKDCDCMGCCPPNPQQDKADRDLQEIKRLLNLLLQRVGTPEKITLFDLDPNKPGQQKVTQTPDTLFKAAKLATQRAEVGNQILGIEAFPMDVPDSMIEPEKSGIWAQVFDFIVPDKRRKLKSIADLIAWQIEQEDAVMGKWHQSITIADVDPETKGDQTETIVLPNVAETLKESILLTSNLLHSQGMLVDICLKILTEASGLKLDVAKALLTIRDIQQYLDYDTQEKAENIAIQVSIPPKDATDDSMHDLGSYLQTSYQRVAYDDWNGRYSMEEKLVTILNILSSVAATYQQKTNQ